MEHGWYQVAFTRELGEGVSPLSCRVPTLAVRVQDRLRVFDAACPHRGAHLGWGGRCAGETVVCPFHGFEIGLGARSSSGHQVAAWDTMSLGGMVFARRPSSPELGLRSMLEAIDRDYYWVPGFSITARVQAELVIENGFDAVHFRPVHGIGNDPQFEISAGPDGEFMVEGIFSLPASPWQRTAGAHGSVEVPYTARAYGGGLILSQLGGPHPYWVLTAATPGPGDTSTIRLSVALPPGRDGQPPGEEHCAYLLRQARAGLDKDVVVWEHLVGDAAPQADRADRPVRAYRKFLRRLAAGMPWTADFDSED